MTDSDSRFKVAVDENTAIRTKLSELETQKRALEETLPLELKCIELDIQLKLNEIFFTTSNMTQASISVAEARKLAKRIIKVYGENDD
jgi:hypothetical protein